MKKIIFVLVAVILLSGCEKKTSEINPIENKVNVFTSIQDAVTKQLVLKCEYTDEDGQKVITYIKGNTVRLDGTGEEVNVAGLMKGNTFYLWDEVKKEGMELDMSKMTADGSVTMGEKPINGIEDVIAVLQEKKDSCSVSPESAGLLELPTDIKFTKAEDFLE